jgi:hypothetical protein
MRCRALIGFRDNARGAYQCFLEPEVAPLSLDLLEELTGGNCRFLLFDPTRPERNYNANRVLVEAIRAGQRGAYRDILRRISGQGCSG